MEKSSLASILQRKKNKNLTLAHRQLWGMIDLVYKDFYDKESKIYDAGNVTREEFSIIKHVYKTRHVVNYTEIKALLNNKLFLKGLSIIRAFPLGIMLAPGAGVVSFVARVKEKPEISVTSTDGNLNFPIFNFPDRGSQQVTIQVPLSIAVGVNLNGLSVQSM